MKIIFPELENPIIKEALREFPDVEPIGEPDLDKATIMLREGQADSMIAGLESPTRDVLIAYKKHLPLQSKYFTSCFVGQKDEKFLVIADGGVCINPNEEQLLEIILATVHTFETYFDTAPKIAMLSYSTKGSGGTHADLDKIRNVIATIHQDYPRLSIDGEMQLDAAVNPAVGREKFPDSPIAGEANLLICPDLNSANILYKGLEQLGGWTMAGPIIQGFEMPLADLSRGSSLADVVLTIDVIKKLHERQS